MNNTTIEHPDLGQVIINHRGDWSGEAIVFWTDDSGDRQETRLPGTLLVALAGAAAVGYVRDKVVAAAENCWFGEFATREAKPDDG